jgi:periplasmic protein TonB
VEIDRDHRPQRLSGALGASLLLHLGLAAVLLVVLSFPTATASTPEPPIPLNVVYLPAPGPAGGGGGKPNPAPPRPVQVAPHNLPAPPPLEAKPPAPEPEKPLPTLDTTVTTNAADVLQAAGRSGVSLDGGGGGRGPGLGPGTGPGLNDGRRGGTGDGPGGPGGDVTPPIPILQVQPKYTTEAMIAKVQGSVRLSIVVRADGTVGEVKIVDSLDTRFGLDARAIEAAKAWRFKPGLRQGHPVDVQVTLILDFRLH